jgi:hypothetical protein
MFTTELLNGQASLASHGVQIAAQNITRLVSLNLGTLAWLAASGNMSFVAGESYMRLICKSILRDALDWLVQELAERDLTIP